MLYKRPGMTAHGSLPQQITRFIIVGVGATLVHWGSYLLINCLFGLTEERPLGLQLSYAAGYLISFVGNYVASLKWTFRTKGSVSKGLGFALSHLINFVLHMGLLRLFLWLGVGSLMVRALQDCLPELTAAFPQLSKPEALLPLPVFCVVIPVNFLLVRFFLTREPKAQDSAA
ncbi:MAG: GtrA family protein [Akkermansia sp.]